MVVREDFSEDMADQLIHDILSITEDLANKSSSYAHLANLSSSDQVQGGKNQNHTKLSKVPHHPGHNRGTKGKGYAKQC